MRKILRSRRVAVLICLVLASSFPLRGGPTEVRSGDRLSYALTGARVILDLRTNVLAAWLDGRALDLTDKQKRLYERYRARPKPVGR